MKNKSRTVPNFFVQAVATYFSSQKGGIRLKKSLWYRHDCYWLRLINNLWLDFQLRQARIKYRIQFSRRCVGTFEIWTLQLKPALVQADRNNFSKLGTASIACYQVQYIQYNHFKWFCMLLTKAVFLSCRKTQLVKRLSKFQFHHRVCFDSNGERKRDALCTYQVGTVAIYQPPTEPIRREWTIHILP